MVFGWSAFQHIQDKNSALFAGNNTMRILMNQTDQKRIIHFKCESL